MTTPNLYAEAVSKMVRLKPNTIIVGEVTDKRLAKRLMRAARRGRQFINGVETFSLSRSKALKLAYRWRGNRRGKRIAAWLARSTLPTGLTIEQPPEYRIK